MNRLERKVHWWPTGDPCLPWAVWFEGEHWEIAVTDVPGQGPRYSLLVNGRKKEEFVDWPASWTTAPDNGGNASQRAEYEHECEYWKKNKDVSPIDEDELGDDDPFGKT
jgi:hypothetical protein